MQSHYEINVAKKYPNGRTLHLFATAPRSCTIKQDMEHVFNEIRKRFPASEFHLSVTYYECVGKRVEVEGGH